MTDTPTQGAAPAASTLTSAPKDSSAQTIVSAMIVVALVALGGGAIIAAVIDHSIATVAFTVVGTAIGSLATALNAPTGIASVIGASRKAPDAAT